MASRKICLVLLVALSLVLSNCSGRDTDLSFKAEAGRIHDEVLTVDTHVDTPMRLLNPKFDLGVSHDPRQRGGKVDFPRMKAGGLDAIFFAVYIGQGKRDPESNEAAKSRALRLFDAIHAAIEKNTDVAQLALGPDDAYRIEKSGKRAIFIGMENGYPVGTDLAMVAEYYKRGSRYITLCHSRNNDICDSSGDRNGAEHHGLSQFGAKVVEEMNRLGMMIDLSHASDESFYDVIELSKAPVIASHSSVRSICDSSRNMTDDMIKRLAENGGVIQICILTSFLKQPEANPERDAAFAAIREKFNADDMSSEERDKVREEWRALQEKYPRPQATVKDLADHIDFVVKLVGIDHVGIGSDFDGGGGIQDCYDVSEMGNITLELVRRGYNEEQIRKIWGGNIMRVFRQVEELAAKSRTTE